MFQDSEPYFGDTCCIMSGVIFDIKKFALHDGPGVRSTVFLRGCPLRCVWCHNPESQGFGVESFAGRSGVINVGRKVSVDEVVAEVLADRDFYDESGGGVTFSGGEPMAQPEFLAGLLQCCREAGLHCAVDTCGYAAADVVREVAESTDLFLYDLKLADHDSHLKYTGEGVKLIHDNLRMLCDMGAEIEVRLPLIPGITDSVENLSGAAKVLKSLSRELPLRLLPYHRAAMDKYARFGIASEMSDAADLSEGDVERCKDVLKDIGVRVI
jgi:pyruvate formate lyase activating enzyme